MRCRIRKCLIESETKMDLLRVAFATHEGKLDRLRAALAKLETDTGNGRGKQ